MVDQPGAIAMWVPQSITFDYTDATWCVIHKTAGFRTAQDCAAYFQSGSGGNNVSSHYIVGFDGTIVQCVPESRGAGANCCTTAGHASYLPNVNLNLKTISIEHIDPTSDNSTPMPTAQKLASFKLVHDICVRHNIPMRGGDASGGIIGHRDIDPINRARCPGNYAWDELWAYLNNGGEHVGIPSGWHDDGTTLTAPDGKYPIVKGFRGYILNNQWDANNFPIEAEHGANPLEMSNPSLGSGTKQRFRMSTLEWTSARGVFVGWSGQELIALEQKVAQLEQQVQSTQNTNVAQLQQELDAANVERSALKSTLAQIATEATNASK